MIDVNRDKDSNEIEYYLNNNICEVEEFYKSLGKDIIIEFNNINDITLEQYEGIILEEIDSAYEVVLNDNIYDRIYIRYDDDEYDDDTLDCGCCSCCGCTCYEDEEDYSWTDDNDEY